jgi:hypothetical protein
MEPSLGKGKNPQEAVLLELEAIARGDRRDPQDQLVWSYVRCQDWQDAADAICRGLTAEERNRSGTSWLSPPPGWLPPIS